MLPSVKKKKKKVAKSIAVRQFFLTFLRMFILSISLCAVTDSVAFQCSGFNSLKEQLHLCMYNMYNLFTVNNINLIKWYQVPVDVRYNVGMM